MSDAAAPSKKSSKPCCALPGCKAKLGLTDFPCKCAKTYCSAHRYPEEHTCSHDYRGTAKEILLKTMSTAVVAAKMEVI